MARTAEVCGYTTEMMGWAKQAVYSVLWFVGLNLSVQNHNHFATARFIYSVAQEREIEGMLC